MPVIALRVMSGLWGEGGIMNVTWMEAMACTIFNVHFWFLDATFAFQYIALTLLMLPSSHFFPFPDSLLLKRAVANEWANVMRVKTHCSHGTATPCGMQITIFMKLRDSVFVRTQLLCQTLLKLVTGFAVHSPSRWHRDYTESVTA